MALQCVFLRTLYWSVRELTPKISNSFDCTLTIKTTKQCQWRRLTSLWCLYYQLWTYFFWCQFFMLCCKQIFFYLLALNISRFFRVCSETRFITKRKEIDIKSAYLNLGSDTVAGLPVLHTFSGADIKGSIFSEGKKN